MRRVPYYFAATWREGCAHQHRTIQAATKCALKFGFNVYRVDSIQPFKSVLILRPGAAPPSRPRERSNKDGA